MKLPIHIARRYLFAKKSHNAINIISIISVCGVALATTALICALSVFNGFTMITEKTFSAFDPQLQIIPAHGKVFDGKNEKIEQIKKLPDIALTSESLEENALVSYDNKQEAVFVRGVSPQFADMAGLRNLIVDGDFLLHEGDVQYSMIGAGLAMNIGVRANFRTPVDIYIPKRNVRVNMANYAAAFSRDETYVGGVFALNQEKYDNQLVLVSLDLMRELLGYETEISALDIKVKEGVEVNAVKKEIEKILGKDYLVQNRLEQQAEMYRIVNVEKWVTFLILAIILIIAVFNVVGSLTMLILEKSEDIKILQSLGANNKLICRIFMMEGWLITFVGALAGMIIGLGICLAQQYLGLLKLGNPGAFAVDAYPVQVQPFDIFIIFITVSLFGIIAVLYPVNNLRKRL